MEKQLGILGYGAVGKSLHSIYENLDIKISIASSIKYVQHLKETQYLEVINLEEYKNQNRGKYEIVIISTKIEKIENYIGLLKDIVTENTIILPVQNGFYAYEYLEKEFGDNVLAASLSIVAKSENNTTSENLTKKATFSISKPRDQELNEVLTKFINTTKNNINYEIISNKQELLWRKFSRIVSLTCSCIYYQNELGEILRNEEKYNFLIDTLDSIKSLASKYGVVIIIEEELKRINNISPHLKTSLYESLERGVPGEFKYIIVEALKRGIEKNIKLDNIEKTKEKIYKKYPWII
tara:strand:- start:33 stop:920 length:888 start_codon:yes stop_codon:yes gene_type:complete